MSDYNKVILLGRLTRDPEIRYTTDGTPVTTFALAVNKRSKSADGQWKEDTDFFDIVAFKTLAERIGEYCQKGRQVLVDGRLQQRKWETPDGQKRSKIEILANDVRFLARSGAGREEAVNAGTTNESGSSDALPGSSTPSGEPPFGDDDIPF